MSLNPTCGESLQDLRRPSTSSEASGVEPADSKGVWVALGGMGRLLLVYELASELLYFRCPGGGSRGPAPKSPEEVNECVRPAGQ